MTGTRMVRVDAEMICRRTSVTKSRQTTAACLLGTAGVDAGFDAIECSSSERCDMSRRITPVECS